MAFVTDSILIDWDRLQRDLGGVRQVEIIKLICRGMSQPEIALTLSLSTHTVRNHLAIAYEKLCVQNNIKLLLKLLQDYRLDDRFSNPGLVTLLRGLAGALEKEAAQAPPTKTYEEGLKTGAKRILQTLKLYETESLQNAI